VTGLQVVDLREALGMSQLELARALNVVPSTLDRWEKDGPHSLGLEVLASLHRAVFEPEDEGADRSARLGRIATELRLGLGAVIYFRLLDVVSKGGSR